MKIWRYWLTETRTLRCMGESGDPFECDFRVTAGSRISEHEAKERLEALLSQSENADLGFRLYKTAVGFRLAVEGRRLEPDGPRARTLMGFFNVDSIYANLCVSQKCYRARLTPKPWRMKMKRYEGADSWIKEYDRRLDSPAIALHDEKTLCELDLPLA